MKHYTDLKVAARLKMDELQAAAAKASEAHRAATTKAEDDSRKCQELERGNARLEKQAKGEKKKEGESNSK